jgi:hypothetical protein
MRLPVEEKIAGSNPVGPVLACLPAAGGQYTEGDRSAPELVSKTRAPYKGARFDASSFLLDGDVADAGRPAVRDRTIWRVSERGTLGLFAKQCAPFGESGSNPVLSFVALNAACSVAERHRDRMEAGSSILPPRIAEGFEGV